jgi:hypothetical protein
MKTKPVFGKHLIDQNSTEDELRSIKLLIKWQFANQSLLEKYRLIDKNHAFTNFLMVNSIRL